MCTAERMRLPAEIKGTMRELCGVQAITAFVLLMIGASCGSTHAASANNMHDYSEFRLCLAEMSGSPSDISRDRLFVGMSLPSDPRGDAIYFLSFGFGKDEAEAKKRAGDPSPPASLVLSGRDQNWQGADGDIAWEGFGPAFRRGVEQDAAVAKKLVDHAHATVNRCLSKAKR